MYCPETAHPETATFAARREAWDWLWDRVFDRARQELQAAQKPIPIASRRKKAKQKKAA
jgi:hypothetical protein